MTANGQLPLELEEDSPSRIHEITVFMYSYETGRNFTVSNATDSDTVDGLGSIMAQEPGSTVKHINWVWPDCLVGNGQPNSDGSDRGAYNVSSLPQAHRNMSGMDATDLVRFPSDRASALTARSTTPSSTCPFP